MNFGKRTNVRTLVGATMALCWATLAAAQPPTQEPVPGKNDVTIRGEHQEVYYLPATGNPLRRTILYAPGIGGWKGWAITVGETMASWGYDVYGLDTKVYLDSFTTKSSNLSEADITRDMQALGEWASRGSTTPVIFVGWSEGAGVGVLALAGAEKKPFVGLATFGLEDSNVIAWHWSENLTSIVKKPHEPTFQASDYMEKIAPLPLMMIQSTHDQYVDVDEAKRLFAVAHDPKRFELVQADNHRFDGNHDQFFLVLREGLQWIIKAK